MNSVELAGHTSSKEPHCLFLVEYTMACVPVHMEGSGSEVLYW